jgi:glycosyltransferase involved in cell wall biosynthesis
LVGLNDRSGFLCRVKQLIADREAREGMGARAYAASREFTIDRCARRYEELFAKLAHCGSGSSELSGLVG